MSFCSRCKHCLGDMAMDGLMRWPDGLPEDERLPLCSLVYNIARNNMLPLSEIVNMAINVAEKKDSLFKVFGTSDDYRFSTACVEKALTMMRFEQRYVSAEEKWVLPKKR